MNDFHFEEQVRLTETDYVAIHGVVGAVSWWKYGGALGLGAVMLLSPYTLVLGVVLLLILLVGVPLKYTVPGTMRSQYRRSTWLRAPFRCGVNGREIWVVGTDFESRFAWTQLNGWRKNDDWLWISGQPGGIAYFPVASLQRAGLELIVRALAKRHEPQQKGAGNHAPLISVQAKDFDHVAHGLVAARRAGAAVILHRHAGPGFLQLATPEVTTDGAVLEFGVPKAEWVSHRWSELQTALGSLGYDILFEDAPDGIGFDTFLRIRIAGRFEELPSQGAAVLDTVRDLLGWRPESPYLCESLDWDLAEPGAAS